jgi:hypothetical protein
MRPDNERRERNRLMSSLYCFVSITLSNHSRHIRVSLRDYVLVESES